MLGPAEINAPWQNTFYFFLSKVLPHSTINMLWEGSERLGGKKPKGFDWLVGLFGKDTTFL